MSSGAPEYYQRELKSVLKGLRNYKRVILTGPRASGKTTLIQECYPQHHYVSLDDPETYALFKKSPCAFLKNYKDHLHGLIIDEWQKYPEFASDKMLKLITQEAIPYRGSLIFVGLYNIFETIEWWNDELDHFILMSPSLHEHSYNNRDLGALSTSMLAQGNIMPQSAEAATIQEEYNRYVAHYVAHDMQLLITADQKNNFEKFLQECAAAVTTQVDYAELAGYCNITEDVAKEWLALLEKSHIVFLMYPEDKDIPLPITRPSKVYAESVGLNKLIWKEHPLGKPSKKSIPPLEPPKLYFLDTGLAAFLLKITAPSRIEENIFYPQLFENFIISDLCRQFYNRGEQPALAYPDIPFPGHEAVTCIIKKRIPLAITTSAFDSEMESIEMRYLAQLKKSKDRDDTHDVMKNIIDQVRQYDNGHIIHDGSSTIYSYRYKEEPTFCYDIIAWELAPHIALNWVRPSYAHDTPFEDAARYRTSTYRRLVIAANNAWKCTCDDWDWDCDCVNHAHRGLPELHWIVIACDASKKYTCLRDTFTRLNERATFNNAYLRYYPDAQKNELSIEEETVLLYAVEGGNAGSVECSLARYHHEAHIPDIYGVTPLHRAAHLGYVDMVKFLLCEKININARTLQGDTPLFYAVEKAHAQIEDILIAEGADVTMVNYQHCTLLDVARYYNNHRMINFLLTEGVHANHMNIPPQGGLCQMSA